MAETNRGGSFSDGSAHPQIIERETRPLYYDILNASSARAVFVS
jgi:hypothetical protein